ncbi:cytochrome c biogenesis protein CcdA [Flaviflexus ciconiae]|uniref:Cytochrome c biogenesis protein CcdA n=1 Tax=Flaviflexus ciconiae TaxID=2496867 RepID=A0A3Q9G671_9ACTO|nr:cytochrome c biogenesis CcdA family protein [Flaviflexus ciconiae]AZQ76225.1 cytochrome c biogenesis protein CcdA [Flaviflexus ciconiae]
MDIGFVTAFVGGVLALLSPCAALLLPAFFASTVNSGPKLFLHVTVFFAGLLVVLVPLGLGAGVVGSLFVSYRSTLITVSAILFILLGVAQIFGLGFDPSKLMPGHTGREVRSSGATGITKTFLLGTTSGIAGFCAGPILGAVLTMAAASGSIATASLLLAVYGAGMIVPLVIIVLLWRPLGSRGRHILRGRSFTFLGRRFHTTSVITGLVITATGIIFWATNGLLDMPELVSYERQSQLQEGASILSNPIVDVVAIILLATIILLVWYARRHRDFKKTQEGNTEEPNSPRPETVNRQENTEPMPNSAIISSPNGTNFLALPKTGKLGKES